VGASPQSRPLMFRNFVVTAHTWPSPLRRSPQIADNYNLILTTERINEGLVVLKNLLGLKYADIAYIPMKVAHSTKSQKLEKAATSSLKCVADERSSLLPLYLTFTCVVGTKMKSCTMSFEGLWREPATTCYIPWYDPAEELVVYRMPCSRKRC